MLKTRTEYVKNDMKLCLVRSNARIVANDYEVGRSAK